jgi:hypothetical protein
MRYWTSTLALLAAAGGTALAQVPPSEVPPTTTPPPTSDSMEPAPAPTPTPTPPTTPRPPVLPPPPPAPPPAADGSELRPTGLSIAIGFGYQLPTSLETPNITSVRFRLPSGLTLEPRIVLASSSREIDTGPSTKDEASELGVGALARFPISRRGRVDLEILGGFNVNQESTRPDNSDEDLTVTTLSAVYGLSVGTWVNRHLQVSLSALNPIVTSSRRDEVEDPATSTVTTNTTIGLIFDPTVALMLHLYH